MINTIMWLSVALFLLICITFIAVANADVYETLGVVHRGHPDVCIFEPYENKNTVNVDEVVQTAKNSVKLWEDKLHLYSPEGDWSFNIDVIPVEEHDQKFPTDFPLCNILISYEHSNYARQPSLGYTHVDFSRSSHQFTHVVVFLHEIIPAKVSINLNETGGSVSKYVELKPFPIETIQNITTHEFGHALGIGHYEVTDPPISKAPWLTRSVMFYALDPKILNIAEPTYVDVKMAEILYKEDGFGYDRPSWIPRIGYYTIGDNDICTFKCNLSR